MEACPPKRIPFENTSTTTILKREEEEHCSLQFSHRFSQSSSCQDHPLSPILLNSITSEHPSIHHDEVFSAVSFRRSCVLRPTNRGFFNDIIVLFHKFGTPTDPSYASSPREGGHKQSSQVHLARAFPVVPELVSCGTPVTHQPRKGSAAPPVPRTKRGRLR